MSDIPLGNQDNNDDDVLNVLADPADMPADSSSDSSSDSEEKVFKIALAASTGTICDIISSIAEEPNRSKAKRLLKKWISQNPETEVTSMMKSFYKDDSWFDGFYHDAKLLAQEEKK